MSAEAKKTAVDVAATDLPDGPSIEPQVKVVDDITVEQCFNEAVTDIFPRFAMVEAVVLGCYAVWIAVFAPWDGFIRVVMATLALGSAIGPPLLAKATVKD
jgi:hypothetical protein